MTGRSDLRKVPPGRPGCSRPSTARPCPRRATVFGGSVVKVRTPAGAASRWMRLATDPQLLGADQTASDADQTASDADQTASDADQTDSDEDQTDSERDDAAAATDQRAADEDQARAEEQRPAGADSSMREGYVAARAARETSTLSRLTTRAARARTAASRAESATERDARAAARDETARLRDLRAEEIERWIAASAAPLVEQIEELRANAATSRALAAADRARAARDRADAARERARLEESLLSAHLDDLTGAYRREMGRLALAQEIDRARRGDGRFVVAFVDVDGLKGVNDRDGHSAGDRLLRTVVATMKGQAALVRPDHALRRRRVRLRTRRRRPRRHQASVRAHRSDPPEGRRNRDQRGTGRAHARRDPGPGHCPGRRRHAGRQGVG